MKRTEVTSIDAQKIIDLAFETKDFEVLKGYILAGDIDINYDPYNRSKYHYLLSRSVGGKCLEFCEFLLQNGVNVNSLVMFPESTLLNYSCTINNIELAKLFIKYGGDANIGNDVYTPLGHSVSEGRIEFVNLLLEHKADVNLKDKSSARTPLEWSVIRDRFEMCELLIKHKADINFENSNPLIHINEYTIKGKEIFNLLLDNGASITPTTSADITLATLEGIMLNVCEGLKTVAPFYLLVSHKSMQKKDANIVEAMKFYSENPLYKLYGNYFRKVLYNKEKLEKCIKFIPNFLTLLLEIKDCSFYDKLFISSKIDKISETYKVATPLYEVKQLIKSDIFDLEHFSIFDYGDHDFG